MGRGADTECSRIEIWEAENESAEKPIVMMDSVGLVPTNLQLSMNNILAVSGDREYEESCSPDVKVSFIFKVTFCSSFKIYLKESSWL